MASLAHRFKIFIVAIFDLMIKVGDRKNNIAASNWVRFVIPGRTAMFRLSSIDDIASLIYMIYPTFSGALAAVIGAIKPDAFADLWPVFRITIFIFRAYRHYNYVPALFFVLCPIW